VNAVTTVPRVKVLASGQEMPPADADRLEQVLVRQRLSQPTLCELTFHDPVGKLARADGVVPGQPLSVEVEGCTQPLFNGEVTALEYRYEPDRGQMVRVRGYDLLHRLRKRQPVRVHLNVQLAGLAQEMLAGIGYTVRAKIPGPTWPRVIQHCQSDFELLADLAQRAGLFLTMRGTVLHVVTLEGTGEAVPLALGETLLEAEVEMNVDTACRETHAAGWNFALAEPHRGSATRPRSGRAVTAGIQPYDTGGTGEATFTGMAAAHAGILEAHAQAELDRRVAGELIISGTAHGNPKLAAGGLASVEGLAEPFCGHYVLTSVTHTIRRETGFITEFSSAPPGPVVAPQPVPPSILGIVTSIDDPDGLGRVRASLPAFNDLVTEWLCVVTPGGGTKKGLVALPDTGDRVLIMPAPGDPAFGVVLGSIPGSQNLPDTGIDAGQVVRYSFQTPGGQRVRLDDAGNLIRLENKDGSFLEMKPGAVMLHSNTDLTIEAPGHNVVIQGERIDFKRK
jgi:phage protein D/phage baseplate assembly protein gpV